MTNRVVIIIIVGGKVKFNLIIEMEKLPNKIMQSLFDTKKNADIHLIAGSDGKRISAHKIILSNATEYFDLMLNGSFREAAESEILIPDIESDVLEAVVKFIYYGSVEISDCEAAIELLKAAHLMNILDLLNYLSDYLRQHIGTDNCLEVCLLAQKFGTEDLINCMISVIIKDLKSISKQEEFRQLDKESLVKIINARNESTCEDDIAEAVLIWTGDEKTRLPSFKELLKLLKINYLNQKLILHQLLKKCNDEDDTFFILQEWKIPKNSTYSEEKFQKLILILNEYPYYKFYDYDVETKKITLEYRVHNYGEILGIWEEKIVFHKDSKLMIFDVKKESLSALKDFHLKSCLINPFKIGRYICMMYYFKCIKISLWDFAVKTIPMPQNSDQLYEFDAFCEFSGELKIAAYNTKKPNNCVVISYNPANDTWNFGLEVFITDKPNTCGHIAAHDNCLYYFKGQYLHIYKPYENSWQLPIQLQQSEFNAYDPKNHPIIKSYSINGQLIVHMYDNGIFKYSNGDFTRINFENNNSRILKMYAK